MHIHSDVLILGARPSYYAMAQFIFGAGRKTLLLMDDVRPRSAVCLESPGQISPIILSDRILKVHASETPIRVTGLNAEYTCNLLAIVVGKPWRSTRAIPVHDERISEVKHSLRLDELALFGDEKKTIDLAMLWAGAARKIVILRRWTADRGNRVIQAYMGRMRKVHHSNS